MFESNIAKARKEIDQARMRKQLESMGVITTHSHDKFYNRKEQLKSQEVEIKGNIKRRVS